MTAPASWRIGDADRAGGPSDLSRCASQPKALIPCAKTFSFDQVERAIARCLSVPEASRSKYRARLRHFLKIKLIHKAGNQRGKARAYTLREAFELFLACALNTEGLMPVYIHFLIGRRRETIHKTAEAGRMLIFHPEGALSGLQDCTVKHTTITLVWPLGAMRSELMDALAAQ